MKHEIIKELKVRSIRNDVWCRTIGTRAEEWKHAIENYRYRQVRRIPSSKVRRCSKIEFRTYRCFYGCTIKRAPFSRVVETKNLWCFADKTFERTCVSGSKFKTVHESIEGEREPWTSQNKMYKAFHAKPSSERNLEFLIQSKDSDITPEIKQSEKVPRNETRRIQVVHYLVNLSRTFN